MLADHDREPKETNGEASVGRIMDTSSSTLEKMLLWIDRLKEIRREVSLGISDMLMSLDCSC